MVVDSRRFMALALDEARQSLREGNNGFGAVVVAGTGVVASAHDHEETDDDPTAHAEIAAIREAARSRGRDLRGCALVTTHEPCPMCAAAVLWSGIGEVAFGYSIAEAIAAGRRRIPMPAAELFERAAADVTVTPGVLHEECAVLYRRDVRDEVRRLRGADDVELAERAIVLTGRRIAWFRQHRDEWRTEDGDLLEAGYRLLLAKLGLDAGEVQVIEREPRRLVFRSRNFCPTLEACRILGLDTRAVCRAVSEGPTDALLRQLHPALRFSRNYDQLRPYSDACEEVISLSTVDLAATGDASRAEAGHGRAPGPSG